MFLSRCRKEAGKVTPLPDLGLQNDRQLVYSQEGPYHVDRSLSCPLCEVMQRRERLELRWGATWEALVLFVSWLFAHAPPQRHVPPTTSADNIHASKNNHFKHTPHFYPGHSSVQQSGESHVFFSYNSSARNILSIIPTCPTRFTLGLVIN